jgi:hypothetical protein
MIINSQMSNNFFDQLPIELLEEIFVYLTSKDENFELLRLVNNNFKSVADNIEKKLGRTIIFNMTRLKKYINSGHPAIKICCLSFVFGHPRYHFTYYKKSITNPSIYVSEFANCNGNYVKSKGEWINISDFIECRKFSYYPAESARPSWKPIFLPDVLATTYLLSKHRQSDNSVFICNSLKKTLDYHLNCINSDDSIKNKKDEGLLWYQNELWPVKIMS